MKKLQVLALVLLMAGMVVGLTKEEEQSSKEVSPYHNRYPKGDPLV